ncbi:MAG: peroxiredoxin [Chloroflexi bacterium]|nr:peroxiredoxin [Chloroflexota bacterium]
MTLVQDAATTGAEVGNFAPDFTASDQNGNPVTLSQFRGKKHVVLFFYPKSFSAGCTAEACAFRDSHEVFKDAGAEVIGISMDSVDTQESFAKRFRLTYTLLSDSDGSLQKLYSIPRWMGLFRGRVTFVIDSEGIIRHVFNSQVMVKDHVSEALETLKSL